MRVGDLIGSPFTDALGRVGYVADVRLVQDGPLLAGGHSAALRIDGLLVARHRVRRLLGYERGPGPEGPWLIRWLVRLLHRDLRYVAWRDLTDTRPGALAVDVPLDSLPLLRDL